jgi:hypothetical protein
MVCGCITSFQNTEQQQHQTDEEKNVYEAASSARYQDADQPDGEHEKSGLQKHVASVAVPMVVFEFEGSSAE